MWHKTIRSQNTPIGRRNNNGIRNVRSSKPLSGRVTKPVRRPLQRREPTSGGVTDARLKIIQKTRQRLLSTDARQKLSELAKQIDARTKIKGRNLKVNHQADRQRERGQGQINRGTLSRVNLKPTPSVLQRSIRNNRPNMRDASSLIRCTINRPAPDYSIHQHPYPDMGLSMTTRQSNDLSNIKVVTHNDYTHYPQEYPARMPEPMYVDRYEPPTIFSRHLESSRNMALGRARMSQEMRARLDSPNPPTPISPPAVVPQGHRIVVSNLHSSVTHEDIKELFEDIGPLVDSRLVRAGTAEVIYKLQRDAKKAVEAYHNRQLDGQPMKCLLVTSRPTSGPSSGVLRSSNIPATPKFPSSSKSMVVPDLSAIHKALFTNK